MPNMSAYASVLRADGYKPRLYLSTLEGPQVLSATVDTTPGDGALNLTITVTSGSASDVKSGMRVTVETAGGVLKGTLSVRYAGTISSTNLPVREVSMGETPIAATDVVRVYEDLMLTDKLVSGDETFAPDGAALTDQTDLIAPVPCSGGSWAGWLNSSGNADVPFEGDESYNLDPDSGSIPSHSWAGTGSPSFVVGNSTSQNPTLRWTAAGRYRVTHTVTDSNNSKTRTQYVRVRVHDANDPPHQIVVTSPPQGDVETGFRVSLNLFENASLADIPDGMHVILWSDDTISGGTPIGHKIAGRSHVVCEGYLRRETSTAGADPETLTVEIVSVLARLAELPGFSKMFITNATPTEWFEYSDLTVKLAIGALIGFYTNLIEQFDFLYDTATNVAYPRLAIAKQNPLDQVRELAKSRMWRIVCDRTCRVEVQQELWAVDIADRASVTKTFTATSDDIAAPAEIERDHFRPVETFRLRGTFAAGTEEDVQPAFARFPATPSRGPEVVIEEQAIIGVATDELFAQCSLRGAWYDRVYFTDDGEQYHAPEMTVVFPLVYARLFQFYREFWSFNIAAADSGLREIALSTFDWIPMSVSEDYDNLTCEVVFRAATYAPPDASVDDTPVTDNSLPPDDDPPVQPIEPIEFPGAIPAGIGQMALFTSNGLAWTTDFSSASPTYQYASWASLSVSGSFLDWVPDGFNSGEGWLFTTTKIYHFVISTRVATLKHSWSATCKSVSADASIAIEGMVCAVAYISGTGTKSVTTTDGFATLVGGGEITITSNVATDSALYYVTAGCHVSSKVTSKIITSAYTSSGSIASGTTAQATYISLDAGATWSLMSNPTVVVGDMLAQTIHVPWHGNATESTIYTASMNDGDGRTYRNATDISPVISGYKYAPGYPRNGIRSSVSNLRRMMMVGQRSAIFETWDAFVSNDGGTTWTTIPGNNENARQCTFSGDNQNIGWLWGTFNYIKQAAISGSSVTLTDKAGNLSDFSIGVILAIGGY